MTKLSVPFLFATLLVVLAGCSDNSSSTTPSSTTPVTPPAAPASVIALGTSTNFILTDNATAATLTATLVDSSNAVMAGVVVSFSTTTGNLSASQATTDVNGQATVLLKSGLFDLTNRTATVTATVGAQSASIPILIKGSTLALTLSPSTSITVGLGTITATATATDSAGLGRSNQTIRFSIGAASTGAGTLSATTLTTDATGVATPLTFTPTAAGTVVLTAEWMNSAGAVTASATQNINVTGVTGVSFAITIPATNPTALSSGATQPLAVTVPTTIGSGTVTSVRISATSGSWTGTNPSTGPLSSIIQTPAGNAVAAIYTAPANSGSVTVQVDAMDGVTTLSSLSRTFAISAPATAAAQVFLSASVSTIGPSSGSNISTATLEAVVRDLNSNTVGSAAVIFGLLGTTGSGEIVSPAVVYTDSNGKATTTFSAGTTPTLAAIHAQASIVGQVCDVTTLNLPPAIETNKLCDTTPLIVSSKAVSVTVGFGTGIIDAENSTQYKLPGSVLVVNTNGSPVPGAVVTLTVFPARYRNGSIYSVGFWNGSSWDFNCGGPFDSFGVVTSFTDNEDINRNGILDDGTLAPAEDTTLAQAAMSPWIDALAIANNGLISPAQAAGGAVLMTVTTDNNGAATFYLQYPKSSAWFIEDEVTARVIVNGTESTARVNYILPMSLTDSVDNNCTIGRTASY